jgi:signal transduction histidine kinase
MRAIAWPRPSKLDLAWGLFAAANLAAMAAWPGWETIPFHFIWISLTLLYGFRVWRLSATAAVLTAVVAATGASILADAFDGIQLWGELFEVPLMSAMFLAMVWHARRRHQALEVQASLLERQEQFVHDASHELRTPITIARGHLELVDERTPELDVALDELGRMQGIVDRLLLLAKASQPGFIVRTDVDLEPFLEDVFIRWAGIAPRVWRLGPLVEGSASIDADAARTMLDALLENAVRHTNPRDVVGLRARPVDVDVVIEVFDGGSGIDADAFERIFERFGRADPARGRHNGGAGLGLAIVDAIARAHGGRCTLEPRDGQTVFAVRLPRFRAAEQPGEAETLVSAPST